MLLMCKRLVISYDIVDEVSMIASLPTASLMLFSAHRIERQTAEYYNTLVKKAATVAPRPE